MTLQQLRYFLATARHGSFTGAAEALHLAQPSLSEQVRRLEAELGAPLFIRVGRGLALTEAGRVFRPEAERALDAVDRAAASVAEVRELRGGTISFGVFGQADWYGLADVIEELRIRHPALRLRAVGQNSAEVADAVRSGDLEAGFVVLPVDDDGLDVRPALRQEVLFTSADPEKTARRMSVRRLAEAPLILYDARWGEDDPTRRQLAERAQRAGVSLRPVIEVEDVDTALRLASRGLGDTVIAEALTRDARFPAGLHTVPFTERIYDTFAFIQRRGARPSTATRAVLEAIEARVETVRSA